MSKAAPSFIRIGLTGGIGSGKSTVGAMLEQQGAGLIDADAIARSVTATGGAAIEPIRQAFGTAFIGADGALDRARMRELVFADPHAKSRLEAIVHPLVGDVTWRTAQALADAGRRVIVFDIPLLVESGHWPSRLDVVVVVDCREATQIARVQQRNGLEPEVIRSIMAAQATRAQRRATADIVIYNDELSMLDLQTKAHGLAAQFGL